METTATAMATTSFTQLVPVMNFAGMLILASFIVFLQWKQARGKVSDDGLKASTEVIIIYKEQITQLRNEVSNLTSKVGELSGALTEKDKQNKMLQDLLLNKNPELEALLKEIHGFIPKLTTNVDNMGIIIKGLADELHDHTEALKNKV